MKKRKVEQNMRNSKVGKGIIIILCTLALTGCGSGTSRENPVDSSTEQGGTNQTSGGENMAEELLDTAALNGSVIEFTDSGCIISPVTTEDGGQSAIIAAAGHEDEADSVNVQYQDDCVFQIAEVDVASGSADIRKASITDIKKQTILVIFGDYTDTENLTASKVIIGAMGRHRREILPTGLPVFEKKESKNNAFISGSFICQQHDLKHKYNPAGNRRFEVCHAGKNESKNRSGYLKGR